MFVCNEFDRRYTFTLFRMKQSWAIINYKIIIAYQNDFNLKNSNPASILPAYFCHYHSQVTLPTDVSFRVRLNDLLLCETIMIVNHIMITAQ